MMTSKTLNACTRDALTDLARRHGVDGWRSMPKAALVRALLRSDKAAIGKKNGAAHDRPAESRRGQKPRATRNGASAVQPHDGRPERSQTTNGRTVNAGVARRIDSTASAATAAPLKPATKKNTRDTSAARSSKKRTPVRSKVQETRTAAIVARPAKSPHVGAQRDRDLCTVLPPSADDVKNRPAKDNLHAMFCDENWLRLTWDVSRESVRRAEMRLGADWHRAVPILRIHEVAFDEANCAVESWHNDIEIQAGCNSWYVHLPVSPASYRVQIGYRTPAGLFFPIGRSNLANFAKQSNPKFLQRHNSHDDSADDPRDAISTRSRTSRVATSAMERFGPGGDAARNRDQLTLDSDVEIILRGMTRPDATLTIQGEPVSVRDDGRFTVRVLQPEGRHIVTLAAVSQSGGERRTIVIGIDRNTKVLETQYLDECAADGVTG